MKLLELLLSVGVVLSGPLSASATPVSQDPDLDILDPIFDLIKIIPVLGDLLTGKIFDEIVDYFDAHIDVNLAFPGLRNVLAKFDETKTSSDDFARGLMNAIKLHSTYVEAFNELDEDLQEKVQAYLNGEDVEVLLKRGREFSIPASPAAKRHFKRMEEAGTTDLDRRWLNAKRQTTPIVYEDEAETKPMAAYVSTEFENWGLTVSNTPAYTFVPTTVLGLQNLVKFAADNDKRVRAAGYRHTWTDIYSEDGGIFVSMLNLKTANAVPDPSSILPDDPTNASNEFKSIEVLESVNGGAAAYTRIGAAVTNEELRRWSIKNSWTLPLNVIMVEITLGGSNAPICHGAGITHKTLSDLVRAIEYVDVNGKHQKVDDPAFLKAAAGSFGLLGVITHVTLELDAMSYAAMKPVKTDINLAIPPPEEFTVPEAIAKDYSEEELAAAREEFISGAQAYYSEYFWFPYQQRGFINVWDDTQDSSGLVDYPTAPDLFTQWVQGWLGGVINDDALWKALPGHWQASILSTLAMIALPPQLDIINADIKTYMIDALHFRRGVQNMRVRDMELQIPIPARGDDPSKPDWSIVQRAWWDAIDAVYSDENAPMRITLELRIMGDSDIIMAPQTNNTFGTASIEVLTNMGAAEDGVWDPFVQEVANRWMGYKDADGNRLNVRPHWSKEWNGLTVDGAPWKKHLKDVSYQEQIPEFLSVLKQIGEVQGWEVENLQKRFSNPLLDYIFFE